MPPRSRDQLALDEVLIDAPELEELLETRQKRRDSMNAVRLQYEDVAKRADGEIEKLELPEGKIARIGRWRLERVTSAERSVSFTTQPKSRVKISMVEDD